MCCLTFSNILYVFGSAMNSYKGMFTLQHESADLKSYFYSPVKYFHGGFLTKATLPEGAQKSGIKIVWILLLSSTFKSHVSSLPNLLPVSPQECLIYLQLHLEINAVLADFLSPFIYVLSQTLRLLQSLVIRFIGVIGKDDCTETDTTNSSIDP